MRSFRSDEAVGLNNDLYYLEDAVDIFSRKWNSQVLYVVYHKDPVEYRDITNHINISSKMLSKTLSELLERDLIIRREDEEQGRVIYTISPEGGELVHHLEDLIRWQRQRNDNLEILLVEDDKMAAELIARQVDDIIPDGYTLHQESTVAQAKSKVSAELDYVLLDRRLPDGKQGAELTRLVRAECESCFILIVSGVTPDREIVKLDIDDYVVKPVSRDELAAHIESVEGRRGLTDLKKEYLAARSKQVGLLTAYGRTAESRPEYRLLNEIIERLPLDEATKNTLESNVPSVTQ